MRETTHVYYQGCEYYLHKIASKKTRHNYSKYIAYTVDIQAGYIYSLYIVTEIDSIQQIYRRGSVLLGPLYYHINKYLTTNNQQPSAVLHSLTSGCSLLLPGTYSSLSPSSYSLSFSNYSFFLPLSSPLPLPFSFIPPFLSIPLSLTYSLSLINSLFTYFYITCARACESSKNNMIYAQDIYCHLSALNKTTFSKLHNSRGCICAYLCPCSKLWKK